MLKTLEDFGVTGHRVAGAPGIYVRLDDPFGHAALAGAGAGRRPVPRPGQDRRAGHQGEQSLRYHGVALNVAMDLSPFARIDPCGYAGLRTVDLATLGVHTDWATVAPMLAQRAQRPTEPLKRPMSTTSTPTDGDGLRRQRQAEVAGQDLAHPDQGGGRAEALKKPDWIRVKAG